MGRTIGVAAALAVLLLTGCSGPGSTGAAPSAPTGSTSAAPTTTASGSATPTTSGSPTPTQDPATSRRKGTSDEAPPTLGCGAASHLVADDQRAAAQENPVLRAVIEGNLSALGQALHGVDAEDLNDARTSPPLVLAIWSGCSPAVTALLEAGADANLSWASDESRGYTPLQAAALNDDAESARALLAHGAGLQVVGRDGQSPIVAAAASGAVEVLKVLLAAGAQPDTRFPDKNYSLTPLEAAIKGKSVAAVDLLLARGARKQPSALYPAVESRSLTMVKHLLAKGFKASGTVTPSTPYLYISASSPAAHAKTKGYTSIAKVLRAAG
ncbi:MAG: uncharacterized protein QG608_3442 [Actinomycetota bacterium]|nr:uncharacterized protein [Actinomycetota bacterium]